MKRRLTPIARELHKNMTDAEIKLWKHLSSKRLGVIFRRQYPIGNYIVDFVSFDARVIIEVDGGQHADSGTDKSRDEWLGSQGFKVLRFWNDDVLTNIEGVIETISGTISPPPLSPSTREGEMAGNPPRRRGKFRFPLPWWEGSEPRRGSGGRGKSLRPYGHLP